MQSDVTEKVTLPNPSDNLKRADVGVVLVHGIGKIKPGEMSSNFAHGLVVTSESDPDNDLTSFIETGRLFLDTGDRKVRFYEAHWSDLVKAARKDFDFDLVRRVAWFPLFNHKRKLYDCYCCCF